MLRVQDIGKFEFQEHVLHVRKLTEVNWFRGVTSGQENFELYGSAVNDEEWNRVSGGFCWTGNFRRRSNRWRDYPGNVLTSSI